MTALTFSSLLNVVKKFAQNKQMTFMVKGFLEEPIRTADIRDERRKQYRLTPKMCSSLFKGEEDIYPNLRRGLNTYLISYDPDGSKTRLLLNRIVANQLQNPYLYLEIYNLSMSDDSLSTAKKNEIKRYYSDKDFKMFFREVFQCAITANNKTIAVRRKPSISLNDTNLTTNEIIDLLNNRERPVAIITPDEIDEAELNYIKELLKVYSEDAHITFVSKSDLSKNPAYLKDFNKQRDYYYAAESIRVGLRDTEVYGKHFFDDLKEEVFTGLEDTNAKSFSTGLEKMNTVMERVTFIPLNSLLMHLPGWIRAQERKGICHMLVNEEKIKWVEDKLHE